MYIHSIYKQIDEKKTLKDYKSDLKQLCKINLRRSSKFNILAVLGAIKVTKNIQLSSKLGIYVTSEYGPINDVHKILRVVNQEDYIVMPFDFLNINSNNVSFYVSQALKAKGKNMLLSSEDLSFEKGLYIAQFDLETKVIDDILIGNVDESLEEIKNYHNYISSASDMISKDYSIWFYINNKKENSLAKIDIIKEIHEQKQVEDFINMLNSKNIYINHLAKKLQKEYDINLIKEIHSSSVIEKFINSNMKELYYIALDRNSKGFIFKLIK